MNHQRINTTDRNPFFQGANYAYLPGNDCFKDQTEAEHATTIQPQGEPSGYNKAASLSTGARAIYESEHLRSQLYASHYKPHINQLCKAIMEGEWPKAINLLRENQSRARKTTTVHEFMNSFRTTDVLPIHLALANPNVPIGFVQALIQAYPEGIRRRESGYNRTCAHIACKSHLPSNIISYILQLFPEACQKQDKLGRLPLHYAIYNEHPFALIKEVIYVYPEAVKSWDNLWWSPLHVACQALPSRDLIHLLLSISPESILMTTRKGSTALDIARGSTSNRKEDIIPILEHFDSMVRNLPVMQNYREALSKRVYKNSFFTPKELHDVV